MTTAITPNVSSLSDVQNALHKLASLNISRNVQRESRLPGPGDDSSRGLNANSLWNYVNPLNEADFSIHVCLRDTVGKAEWVELASTATGIAITDIASADGQVSLVASPSKSGTTLQLKGFSDTATVNITATNNVLTADVKEAGLDLTQTGLDGAGLVFNGSALDVRVDGTTLVITSDTVGVKAGVYQSADATLNALAALTGAGIPQATATDTWAMSIIADTVIPVGQANGTITNSGLATDEAILQPAAASTMLELRGSGGEQVLLSHGALLGAGRSLQFQTPGAPPHYVDIKVPTTILADYALTLPQNDGNALQFLQTDGFGVTSWATAITSAYVHPDHSGDVTSAGDGVTTIALNAVTFPKMQAVSANVFLGNDANGTAVEELTATQARTILNVADGANAYVHPDHSGDVTSVADGATTIGANKVTYAMLQQSSAGYRIMAKPGTGAGNYAELVAGAGGVLRRGGVSGTDNLAFGTIRSINIADGAVALSNLQNAGANSVLLGSGASGIGLNYVEIVLGTNLSMSGTTLNAASGVTDHGALTGLSDDDHTQYLLASGTRALSGDWDAGAFEIRAATFESDVTGGTAPFTVASTTVVTNLNADYLDGFHGAAYVLDSQFDANTILKANADNTPIALTVGEQTLVGRITAGSIAALTATEVRTLLNVADGANAYVHPNHSGDVTSVADGATTIAANAVTLAKMQNAGANSVLLGSGAAGFGLDYAEIALGTNLSMSGTTLNATGGSAINIFDEVAAQNITTADTAITTTDNQPYRLVTTSSNLTLTAQPTIAAGRDGQLLLVKNVGSNNLALQDVNALGGSLLRLAANTLTIQPGGTMGLIYDSTIGFWIEQYLLNPQTFTPSVATFTIDGSASAIHEIGGASEPESPATHDFAATYVGTPSAASVDITGGGEINAGDYPQAFSSPYLSLVGQPNFYRGTTTVGGTRTFQVNATVAGVSGLTRNATITYQNSRYWGKSTKGSDLTTGEILALSNSEISNTLAKTVSNYTTGAGEHFYYAVRGALGSIVSLSIEGEIAAMTTGTPISHTNASNFAESFNQYRSTNTNFGSIKDFAFSASLHNNRVYMGPSTDVDPITNANILALDDTSDGESKISGSVFGTYTAIVIAGSNYLWFCHPDRINDLATIKDGTTGFAIAGSYRTTVSHTNQYGYVENYRCWRSDNVGIFPSGENVVVT